jgi:hypothetical protein
MTIKIHAARSLIETWGLLLKDFDKKPIINILWLSD